jgi:peptide/nickel transport system permease protein
MNSNTLWLIGRRFGAALVTLLIVSMVVFAITAVLPGDAAQQSLGQFATPEQVAALRLKLGLDQPGVVRYLHWLMNLLGGDLGQSVSSAMPVSELMAGRVPNTLMLAAVTAVVSVPVALTLGIGSAMGRGGRIDSFLSFVTLALVAVPEFLVATLAVLVFAVNLGWLSALSYASEITSPWQFMRTYALPVMTLCFVIVAQMARMTRAAVIDQLDSPYVEMARLKGVSPMRIVMRHALPDCQRGGAEPVLPAGRRGDRRDHLQLPRYRQPDGGCRDQPRHGAGAGLHHAVLHRVPGPGVAR